MVHEFGNEDVREQEGDDNGYQGNRKKDCHEPRKEFVLHWASSLLIFGTETHYNTEKVQMT
jgi:hypothetical protein